MKNQRGQASISERGQASNTQRGQASMEAVLLLVIVTIVAIKISSLAQSQGLMRSVVEGPWAPIRGMIEDGVWMKYQSSRPLHPNHIIRHQSKQGDRT
jgi:hypothetical protein